MRVKQLKELTWREFVTSDVDSIETWPYMLFYELKKIKEDKESKVVDIIYNKECQEIERFLEFFIEKRKAAIGWIFSALIGVLGNLAVNLSFGTPFIQNNVQLWLLVSVLILLLLFITLYFNYLPKVSITLKFFQEDPSLLPVGYERYINPECCTKLSSKRILQDGVLNEVVNNFCRLVRFALLKESLTSCQSKLSYVCISKVRVVENPTFTRIVPLTRIIPYTDIIISLNGIKPWLAFNSKDQIKMELIELSKAIQWARIKCYNRKVELNPSAWKIRGPDFLDSVSDWDFKEALKTIINLTFKSSTSNQAFNISFQ